MKYKHIIRPALITIGLLLIPVIGMSVSKEWNWSAMDFIIMGILIFGFSLAYELISRKGNSAYRSGTAIAAITTFGLLWVNMAVGIIGEDEWPNLMYLGVVLIGLMGAFISYLKPRGLSVTMFVMAIAQMLVPVIALIVERPLMEQTPGIIGVFMLNTVFAILFAGSGLLFRKAGESEVK